MKNSILKKLFEIRGFRFVLVGGLNTLFGFTVFGVIAYLGGRTWQALLGSNVAGIVFNFLTIGGIVFRDHSPKRLLRFVAAYFVLFLFNLKAIELLRHGIQIDLILAQALLTAPMAILSYLIMSRFVFPSRADTSAT
jgi:putative flippase GtrA